MRSRRTLYLLLLVAAVLFVASLVVEPAWLRLLATVAACIAAVGAAWVQRLRSQDPNGPRGQH